jgi:transcriptional regulator
MYLPESFAVTDRSTLWGLVRQRPFATLVSHGPAGLAISHVPLLVDTERSVLRGHLARANEQVAHVLAGTRAMAVFHGPHGYVSPSVYGAQPSVPTWNYVVVHAGGPLRALDEPALVRLLEDEVARFDPTGWRYDAPPDYTRRMLDAIVGFELEVDSLEGKWKVSQNRPDDDRERVAAFLEGGDAESRALASWMRGWPPARA